MHANGFAIGADGRFTPNALIGFAYSTMWGENKFKNGGKMDQDTYMFAIYSDLCLGKLGMGKLDLSTFAAYGFSRNHAKLPTSNTKWNGHTYMLNARLNYNMEVTQHTLLSPYVRLTWLYGKAESCRGEDVLVFGKQSMSFLQANIGVRCQHRIDSRWGIWGNIAVNPELYRRNPKGRIYDDMYVFDAYGSNPGRLGMNVSVGVHYSITDQWMLTTSYSLQTSSNFHQQTIQAGASYSF